jgi:pimeloyl-ACP methyl ester carboxylesterase
MRRSLALLLALVLLAAAACSGSDEDAGTTNRRPSHAVYAPRFAAAACPRKISDVAGARCGRLIVPERRSDPAGRSVRLFVTRLPSRTEGTPLAPVLVLQGGPGDTPDLASFVDHPLRDGHEVVILDQRGTGRSQPSLACPEISAAMYASLGVDLDQPSASTAIVSAARACHDRLLRSGIDLAAYNTAENAADVADLRVALDIPEWNLAGNSYGSRLALTVLRDHPQGIRALGLSGAYPPDTNTFTEIGDSTADAFDRFFATRAPALRAPFIALLRRLEQSPVRATATTADGRTLTILFDGDNLVRLFREGLYSTNTIAVLPALIDQLASGTGFQAVAQIVAQRAPALTDPDRESFGLFYSVQCQEDWPRYDARASRAAAARYPSLAAVTPIDFPYAQICSAWDVGEQSDSIRRPVESDVPVAMFTGAMDPATPPAWARAAATHLSHAYVFVLDGYGHDTTALACPRAARNAFFANPQVSPDAPCLHVPPS